MYEKLRRYIAGAVYALLTGKKLGITERLSDKK